MLKKKKKSIGCSCRRGKVMKPRGGRLTNVSDQIRVKSDRNVAGS